MLLLSRVSLLFRLGEASFLLTWQNWCLFRRLRRFGYINRTISVRDLLHNSDTQLFSKMCLPGHSSCTPCFLLGVSVLTCDLQDTIFNCLIIVLHCIKDPSLFVHYLNLFNLFNCIELLTSYATSLFWCAFVASILKVTYFFTSLKEGRPNAYFRQQSVFSLPSISLWIISAPRGSRHAVVWYFDRYTNVSVAKPVVCLPFNGWTVKKMLVI